MPKKPIKPTYVGKYHDVTAVLKSEVGLFDNPGWLDKMAWPREFADILKPSSWNIKEDDEKFSMDTNKIINYFTSITRSIIKREVISMPRPYPNYKEKVFQIDVTRE